MSDGAGCQDGVRRRPSPPPQEQQNPPQPSKTAEFTCGEDEHARTGPVQQQQSDDAASGDDGSRLGIIEVTVVSDTMCPWCYVGKRNLEEAVGRLRRDGRHSDVDVNVEWRPYFLDVNLPPEGKPVRDYYRDNYGNPDAGEEMQPHLVAAGRAVGLDFESSYGGLTHYRPTMLSHRLIEYSMRREGAKVQNSVVEALFDMYFSGRGHLNSIPDLVRAAETAGLTKRIDGTGTDGSKVLEEYLRGHDGEAEVLRLAEEARSYARGGVPTFVIRGKNHRAEERSTTPPVVLSGARGPDAFVGVFRHFLAKG